MNSAPRARATKKGAHLRGVRCALRQEAVDAGSQHGVRQCLHVAMQLLRRSVGAAVGEAQPWPEPGTEELEQHADGRRISRQVEARLRLVVGHGGDVDGSLEVARLMMET
jgi:hypothetical protein